MLPPSSAANANHIGAAISAQIHFRYIHQTTNQFELWLEFPTVYNKE